MPSFNHCLDPDGGRWDISPAIPFSVERRYLRGTNILETRFATDRGEASLFDYMLIPREHRRPLLVRMVRTASGSVPMTSRLVPTDGFTTDRARVEPAPGNVRLITSGHSAIVSTTVPAPIGWI